MPSALAVSAKRMERLFARLRVLPAVASASVAVATPTWQHRQHCWPQLAFCGLTSQTQTVKERWEQNSDTWCKEFSWLKWNGTALGCNACSAVGCKTAWGKVAVRSLGMLQPYCFRRHGNSTHHKEALRHIDVAGKCVPAVSDVLCPSTDVFEKLIDDILDGELGTVGRKRKQLLWCVEEAIKSEDQAAIWKAAAIFLFRDERHSRLLLRFRAVQNDLTCTRGVLGKERDFGTGARNLLQATVNILKRSCTRFHGAPQPSRSKPFLKKKLLGHLRTNVIGIAIHSAADELLCSEMMRDPGIANMREAVTPNLKHIMRDRAHATRRLISRPWGVDAFIKNVVMMFCRGRGSIARLIQNSRENRRLFAKFARARQMRNNGLRSTVANFRAAGHRFESFQKPFGRTCLYIIAVIQLACHLALHRSADEPGKLAAQCLVRPENCLAVFSCFQLLSFPKLKTELAHGSRFFSFQLSTIR